ncbi:DUF4336 domain-containing protein [Hyphomicrobiales bacterium 4NK60-0047b]
MTNLYTPIYELKPVGEDIWIVDGEVISFYGAPYTTRMTIIRLENGDLFCHSPIALTKDLKEQVEKLGKVKHLVSPNWIHYAYIPEWAKAFEDTVAWASPKVRERAKEYKVDLSFDHDLQDGAEPIWEKEIDQLIAKGSKAHQEVVFFHKKSKTLILTDLIENFESKKIPFWFRVLGKFAGIIDPDGKTPIDMRYTFFGNHKELRKAVEQMINWQPEKIIIAHGKWFEKDAVAELKRAFRWCM